LPPAGRSYKDFDYAKLQQDVRRFLYEREKLRAAAAEGSFATLHAEQLNPYPGRFLEDDLEKHAVEALRIHRPSVFDINMLEPEAFVERALQFARQAAAGYLTFARAWPEAMEILGRDPALRHVARGILP
jgi:hypothetical protein